MNYILQKILSIEYVDIENHKDTGTSVKMADLKDILNQHQNIIQRQCSLTTNEPNEIFMTSVLIDKSERTNVGGVTLSENVEKIPSIVMEEKFEIAINGPTIVETNGRIPNITIINRGPVIHFSDQMVEQFSQNGTLENLVEKMYQLKIESNEDQNDENVPKHTRERSIKQSCHQSIKIDHNGVTINNGSYSLRGLSKSKFLDNYIPREYKWLLKMILTTIIMGSTFGLIYLITPLVEALASQTK